MTVKNLLDHLDLFPFLTAVEDGPAGARLHIAGCDLEALADEYGTPLYVYDRATLDRSVYAYKEALARFYPGEAGLTYAGKAYLCTGIAQWTQTHDLWLDCTGEGELYIAGNAHLPREHILVHGVNKSLGDLGAAMTQAGMLVFDNLNCPNRRHPGLIRSSPVWWRRIKLKNLLILTAWLLFVNNRLLR